MKKQVDYAYIPKRKSITLDSSDAKVLLKLIRERLAILEDRLSDRPYPHKDSEYRAIGQLIHLDSFIVEQFPKLKRKGKK